MEFAETPIPGAFLIRPKRFSDERGSFVKVFSDPTFQSHGIDFRTMENFHSVSQRGVIRGMHFQVPPAAHHKLVYCIVGRVLDVMLDLRRGSPTFGQFLQVQLSGSAGEIIFVPAGVAHGFLSLEDDSVVAYAVTTAHRPECDRGIRWDSFGVDWPIGEPIVSARDQGFPALAEFDTPFLFSE